MQLAATTGLVICKVSIWYVPPLVVVVEVGVGGLVVEGQVGGAGEPRQRHVGLSGAFLKGRKRTGLNYESSIAPLRRRVQIPAMSFYVNKTRVLSETVQIIRGLHSVQCKRRAG